MSLSLQSNNPNLPLVAPLNYFARESLALAGGKGANLGELIKAGFEVPAGFVITTRAYDLLLEANGLQTTIREFLASLQIDHPASVTEMSRRIHDAFQHAAIPAPIVNEALKAYRQLDGGAVAVRSSAIAEDLTAAAFAGQPGTFLNVIGVS